MQHFSLILLYVLRDLVRARTIFLMVVASLAVASISVLTTSGVLAGFQYMLESGAKVWVSDLVIIPRDDRASLDHAEDVATDIATLEHVIGTSVRSAGTGAVRYKEKTSFPFGTVGFENEAETIVTGLPETLIEGEFFDAAQDSQSVVLGLNLADSLIGGPYDNERVTAGEYIDFIGSTGETKRYQVKGIIDAKTFLPNWSLFMQKNELEKLGVGQRNNMIVIKLDDSGALDAVRLAIQERHPETLVHTWQEESGYVEDILQTVRFITLLITYLLIFSVFIIIAIVIFINISQKRRQIGIMKSMGATTSFIVTIYVLEALLYFLLSFICGMSMFLIIHNFSVSHPTPLLIGDFHTVIDLQKISLYFSILLFASLIGGFLPSTLIARQKIIDALRST